MLPTTVTTTVATTATTVPVTTAAAITAFKYIEPKILDIAEKHSLDKADPSTAYATRNQQRLSRKAQQDKCTWCRKHNLTFIGYVYTNCNELKKHKEKQPKKKPVQKTGKGERQKTGNVAKAETNNGNNSNSGTDNYNGFATTVNLTALPPVHNQRKTKRQKAGNSADAELSVADELAYHVTENVTENIDNDIQTPVNPAL